MLIKEIIENSWDMVEKLFDKNVRVTGVPSGFYDLDIKTTGFQPSQLIVVGGRPGMGKTSLCLNIARNAALKAKTVVAYFNLETSKEELGL